MADKKEFQVGDWIVVDNFDNDKPHLGITEGMQVIKGIPFKILSIQDRVRDGAIKFNVIEHMGYVWHPHWMRYATAGDFVKCGMEVPKELQQVPKNKPPKKKRRIVKPKALGVLLNQKVSGNPGTASYALRFKKKGDVFQVRDICNARMNWGYGQPAAREELLEINIHIASFIKSKAMDKKREKAYRRYIKYITQESPWAICFLKQPISAVFQYGAKLNLQRSLSELMGAAIALREGSEYNEKLETFTRLLSLKFSPNVAFLTSRYIHQNRDGRILREGMARCHQVLNEYMLWNHLKKFFKDGYKDHNFPIATTLERNYTVHNTIAITDYYAEQDCLTRNVFAKVLNDPNVKRGFGQRVNNYKWDDVVRLAQFIEDELKA